MNLQGAPAGAATTLVPVQMSVTLLGVGRSRPLDQSLGAAAPSAASLGPADRPHLSALSSSAEEAIAAIGLEPRNAHSGRHLERFQDLPRSRIDSPQIALVTFPGGVPELSVDPGDPGDEAVGLDGAKNRPCLGIDLMDLPVPILPHPERPFGPREPRVTAAAGRRDRGEHSAGLRIDLLYAILGELKQVLAVEGRSCMRGDIDRAQRLPARRIEGDQLASSSKPDVLTVIRDSMHAVGTRKGSIFTDDLGGLSHPAFIFGKTPRGGGEQSPRETPARGGASTTAP